LITRNSKKIIFVDYEKLLEMDKKDNCEVNLTIDREQEDWTGHVGFVPNYVKELTPDLSYTVVICGPPIMIDACISMLMQGRLYERDIFTEKFLSAADATEQRSPLFKRV
jgi:phenol hydroxylase P5 protein